MTALFYFLEKILNTWKDNAQPTGLPEIVKEGGGAFFE